MKHPEHAPAKAAARPGRTAAEPTSVAPAAPARDYLAPAAGRTRAPLAAWLAERAGEPVPIGVRAPVERSVGFGLGHARLHTGPDATRISRELGAAAFTLGHHVVAGPRARGDVLAHELVHVAQATTALPTGPLRVGAPGSAVERDADDAIDRGVAPRLRAPGGVVHRRTDMELEYNSSEARRERRLAEERRAREAAARRRRWDESREATFGGYLATQGTSLDQDLLGTDHRLIPIRLAAMTALQGTPGMPADLSAAYAQARQAVELVDVALPTGAVPPETATVARAALETFYFSLLSLSMTREREEAAREAADSRQREANRREFARGSMGEPGARAALGGLALSDSMNRYRAPPAFSPNLREWARGATAIDTVAHWRGALGQFRRAVVYLDQTLSPRLPATFDQREAFEQLRGLYERQTAVRNEAGDIRKIPAVFYPDLQFVTVQQGGQDREVAKAIPWFFYLVQDAERSEWRLIDATSPQGLRVNRAYDGGMCTPEPPLTLFSELNSRLRFPTGQLYFTLPSGRSFVLATTEPWSLSDWFRAIGLTLAALGLILATAGAGTPAAVAFVAAAGYSVAATVASLHERNVHGMLRTEDWLRAALSIAADIAGALSLGLGTVARLGATTASLARVGASAARYWAPMTRLAVGLDGVQLLVFTGDFVAQWRALANQPGLTPEQRREAQARLIAMSTLFGGLQVLGIAGNTRDLARGLPIVIDVDAQGRNIVRPAAEPPAPRTGTEAESAPGAPRAGPAAGGSDLVVHPPTADGAQGSRGAVRARYSEVGLDPSLGNGSIAIDVRRGPNGRVSVVEMRWGPNPRPQDLAIHRRAAALAQTYGGLLGWIRDVWDGIRRAFGGRPVPMHIQLEIWKLERAVDVRLQMMRQQLSPALTTELEHEVSAIRHRVDTARRAAHDTALAASAFNPNRIMIELTPQGYPPAPAGHQYRLGGEGRFELHPVTGHTGARMTVVFDGQGRPAGLTNAPHVEQSGILTRRIDDPAALAQLESLGYRVEGRTLHPTRDGMVGLEVAADGSIRRQAAVAVPEVPSTGAAGPQVVSPSVGPQAQARAPRRSPDEWRTERARGVPDDAVGTDYRAYLRAHGNPRDALDFEQFKAQVETGLVWRQREGHGIDWVVSPTRPEQPRPPANERTVPRGQGQDVGPSTVRTDTDDALAALAAEHHAVMAAARRAGIRGAGENLNVVTAQLSVTVVVGDHVRTYRFHFVENLPGGGQRPLFFASGPSAAQRPITVNGTQYRGVTVGEHTGGTYTGRGAGDVQTPGGRPPTESEARQQLGSQLTPADLQGYRHSETALAEMMEARVNDIRNAIRRAIEADAAQNDALRRAMAGGSKPRIEGVDVDVASTRSVCDRCERNVSRLQGAGPLDTASEGVRGYAQDRPPFPQRLHDALDDFFDRGGGPPQVAVNTTYGQRHHLAGPLPATLPPAPPPRAVRPSTSAAPPPQTGPQPDRTPYRATPWDALGPAPPPPPSIPLVIGNP